MAATPAICARVTRIFVCQLCGAIDALSGAMIDRTGKLGMGVRGISVRIIHLTPFLYGRPMAAARGTRSPFRRRCPLRHLLALRLDGIARR